LNGLNKFHATAVWNSSSFAHPGTLGDAILARQDGSIYLAERNALYRIDPAAEPKILLRGIGDPGALCEGPDGTVAVLASSRAVLLRGTHQEEITFPLQSEGLNFSCAFDPTGTLWLGADAKGWFRRNGNTWTPVDTGFKDSVDNRILTASDGRGILITITGNSVIRILPDGRREPVIHPGRVGKILGIFRVARGILVTGAEGFALVEPGRTSYLSAERIPAFRSIRGYGETTTGDSWLSGPESVSRVRTDELMRAFYSPSFSPVIAKFGYAEGLVDSVVQSNNPSVAVGRDGRVWLLTSAGISVLDANKLRTVATVAPQAAITGFFADDLFIRDPSKVSLKAGSANVRIRFSAIQLSQPGTVRVRYRLHGFDKDWIEAGQRRDASYTNLAPGTYRFEVATADRDGAWSKVGAVVSFDLPATFVQSGWFMALCLALGLLALWILFSLRSRQLTHRIRQRTEDRLIERERIARELHDTLLQSVQGLVLRFQSIVDRLSRDEPARDQLEAALARADGVMIEARERVRDLRLREEPDDLAPRIAEQADLAGLTPGVPVEISTSGNPRPLGPLVGSELSRIASEAFSNIARHADATSVQVVISFDASRLSVRIADDGVGLPPGILARGGREGHYGLTGMRERAEKIGGHLTIERAGKAGTVVTTTVPARLAFADYRPNRFARWLDRIRNARHHD
jgi:signal transduction histidine kinase